MQHIVYKTIRRSTGEYYIGVHSTHNVNDKYMGSGRRIKAIIAKYGKTDLERITLYECDTRDNAFVVEHSLLTMDILNDTLCLNLVQGGKGRADYARGLTDSQRQKLSDLHKGKRLSEVTRKRISQSKKNTPSPLKGTVRDRTIVEKIRIANMGKIRTEEHKKKLSIAGIGKKRPPEVIEKIRAASTGRIHSEDAKFKMRKPKQLVKCPRCNIEGGISQMKRWHFDNCKSISFDN